jgi:hypothetical protein
MTDKPKVVLDLDQLTPRDFKRARVMLGGRDPGELIEVHEDRTALIIWCVRSRDDPGFTWDMALDTPWSECVAPDTSEPDPQPASTPASNGSSPSGTAKTSARASRPSATSSD